MNDAAYEARVLELLGDPKEVDRDLRAFQADASLLSSEGQQFLARYPKQWIAIYHGAVVAHEITLLVLTEKLTELGVPRGRAVVRYIDNEPRKMILAWLGRSRGND